MVPLLPTLIEDLRRRFLNGATPSRLMQTIIGHYPDEPRIRHIIADYFTEAFGIPLVRNVVGGVDYTPAPQHAHFNRDLIPEMIEHSSEWANSDLENTWLQGVVFRTFAEHRSRLQMYCPSELKKVWDQLSDKERINIVSKLAHGDYLWDVTKLLAALADRLQAQVCELETRLHQLTTVNSSETATSGGSGVPLEPVRARVKAGAKAWQTGAR